jgi:ABC-type sulfate/molybdate transport systems ATPase subunit
VVGETLALVRLSGWEKRSVATLSGGERQRVAIARAMAVNPSVLLLDEPFSGLDAPLRRALRDEFLEIRSGSLRAGSRAPWIFVTHDREEAAALAGQLAIMDRGRVVESGECSRLFLEPQTVFAARFLGAGQVIRGVVWDGVAATALGAFPLPGAPNGEACILIPRGALMPAGSAARPGCFRARLVKSVFTGRCYELELEIPGPAAGRAAGTRLTAECASRADVPVPGNWMDWYVEPARLRLLR